MADVSRLVKKISRLAAGKGRLRLMEVCGTHTVAIFRAGIRQLLPANVELVSGPGCPVCVTCDDYIDKAIAYARRDFIIATFGDMLKVPGSRSTLAEAQAAGADVRIIYSPLDALQIAEDNPRRRIVLLAVGFETTAPTQAATLLTARARGLKNFFVLSAQKLVPPALRFLLGDAATKVDGFLLPGHVAVVTGADAFNFLTTEFNMPSAVGGFEAKEILTALSSILEQIDSGRVEVVNDYRAVVKAAGNVAAQKILAQVYEAADAEWRGMGTIRASGLRMRDEFAAFDIERVEPLPPSPQSPVPSPLKNACRCGEVLRGLAEPVDCPLFGKACQPLHAVGACMVSVEGVCAAWFKYGGRRFFASAVR